MEQSQEKAWHARGMYRAWDWVNPREGIGQ